MDDDAVSLLRQWRSALTSVLPWRRAPREAAMPQGGPSTGAADGFSFDQRQPLLRSGWQPMDFGRWPVRRSGAAGGSISRRTARSRASSGVPACACTRSMGPAQARAPSAGAKPTSGGARNRSSPCPPTAMRSFQPHARAPWASTSARVMTRSCRRREDASAPSAQRGAGDPRAVDRAAAERAQLKKAAGRWRTW